MKTMFISTYDNLITIGLLEKAKLIDIKEHISSRSHSEYLMPLINQVLEDNNLKARDLTEIIVVNGPGSFTGVRLGVTISKTLAYTLDIPLKTINTIEALAVSDEVLSKKIISVSDPKGRYYGIFENNQLISEISYLSEDLFSVFLEENPELILIDKISLNLEVIYDYLKNQPSVNPHLVKPVYVKQIEVQNG